MNEPVIHLTGVAKTFRSPFLRRPKVALEDLSLAVHPGEIFGFLGPNGAGKTTTIKILLGLVRPTQGTGTVLGQPFGSVEARRCVGFLPDTPSFYRYLSGREYLTLVGSLHGIRGPQLRNHVDEVLERVHLAPEAVQRQLRTYSRGMLQRVGIAAAIMHGPQLVILDEPMNGLDPLGRREFRDLILSLKRNGAAVFLSSHVLADIESTADRVAILDRGRLLECGPLAEILAGGCRPVEIVFELRGGVRPGEIAAGIDELRASTRGWIASIADPDRACVVASRILDSGGRILEMGPRRTSLEQFFVERLAAASLGAMPGPERARPALGILQDEALPSATAEVHR
jgi:ABC-2 type transport system ATP-binding protein